MKSYDYISYVEAKSRIVKNPKTGCWLWAGTVNGYGKYGRGGYPVATVSGKRVYVHRLAYEAINGAIPAGMMVCHTCDTRRCVNPEHLYAGDAMQNHLDKVNRGRARSPGAKGDANATRKYPGMVAGENNGRAVITRQDVEAIRSAYATGEQQRSIAVRFGLGQSQISRICRGEHWK